MNEKVFNEVWDLKKKGYSDATIRGYSFKPGVLSKLADLNDPERIREVIVSRKCSSAFKEALANTYDHYARVNGLFWTKPFFRRGRALPYIANSEQIGKTISRVRSGTLF